MACPKSTNTQSTPQVAIARFTAASYHPRCYAAIVRASELFRDSAVRTVLLALVMPVTVVLSACGVGLPLWSLATLAMVRGHLAAAGVRARRPSMLAGLLLVGLLAALAMAAGLGVSIAEHVVDDDLTAGLGGVAGAAALLALLSPLSFIVPALLDPRCPTAMHALRAALDGWSRVSITRRIAISMLPVCALVPVPILIAEDARPETWAWSLGIPIGLVGALTSLVMVASWLEVRAVAEEVQESGRVPRGTLVLGGITALVTFGVGAAVTVALMTPVPMTASDRIVPRRIDQSDAHTFQTAPLRIEGTTLTVRLPADRDGLMIEADDGGGVGHVEPPYGRGEGFRVRRLEGEPEAYRVVLRDYGTDWYVDIDASGVRIDDGLGARFAHHVGLFGLTLLMLLALGWLASVVAGVKLARAQTLRGIKASTDHRSADRRRVLEGTLRLTEGSTVELSKGELSVKGSASIEGAGLRVRIPDHPVRVRGDLLDSVAELRDGSAIALVGTFERLTSEGHRDANAPWPEHAFVVPGGRALAVTEEIRRASSLAVAAITPTLIVGLGFLLYLGLESM